MIGLNDAPFGGSMSTRTADLQSILDDVSTYCDLIILECIGIRIDSGDSAINNCILINTGRFGFTSAAPVIGGPWAEFINRIINIGTTLGPDDVHQLDPGLNNMAYYQFLELASLFGLRTGGGGSRHGVLPSRLRG
jgi:hypothetical protein